MSLQFLLDGAGVALLLSAVLAAIYEGLALGGAEHVWTTSAIVQRWTKANQFVALLVTAVLLVAGAVLGVHFLGWV